MKRILFAIICSLLPLQGINAAPTTWKALTADLSNGTQGLVVPLEIPANTLESVLLIPSFVPISMAITPNTNKAFTIGISSGNIFPINLNNNVVGAPIVLNNSAQAESLGVTPDGKTLLVTTSTPSLVKVDIQSLTQTPITNGITSILIDIAITPDGKKAYLVDETNSTLVIIDLTTNQADPDSPIALPFSPSAIALTPDGTVAIVLGETANCVAVVDLKTNSFVSQTNLILPALSFPSSLAITPDGQKVYVGISNTSPVLNMILPYAIQGLTITPEAAIPLDVQDMSVAAIAFTPDGNSAYVVNLISNTITEISNVKTAPLATFSTSINANGGAGDVKITPDQAPIASFSFSPTNNHSLPATVDFDASASSSPIGTIATYIWNFGDGSPIVTTTSPTISHTFTTFGDFSVRLRVINSAGTSNKITFTGKVVSNNGQPRAVQTQIISVQPPISLSPPTDFHGKQIEEKFATQTDLINSLRWDSPTQGTTPVSFAIYRDSALTDLVAIVPADEHSYLDHNRHPDIAYTYFIVSIAANGARSAPASITVFS